MTLTTLHLQSWLLVSRGLDWKYLIKPGEGSLPSF